MNNECITLDDGVYCKVPLAFYRKPPSRYRKVGVLAHSTLGPIPLYGVRTDPRAGDWYYYTVTNDNLQQGLPIFSKKRSCQRGIRGCDELSDGDIVTVQGYPSAEFTVSLFENNSHFSRYV